MDLVEGQPGQGAGLDLRQDGLVGFGAPGIGQPLPVALDAMLGRQPLQALDQAAAPVHHGAEDIEK